MLNRVVTLSALDGGTLPPLSPDLIDEAISSLGQAVGATSRPELLAFAREALPDKISPASRERFARYLIRPYMVDDEVDTAALTLLGSDLSDQSRRQVAVLQLAASEPILGAFLDECLPDPGWRRFTTTGLTNWVSRKRGQADRTTIYRLVGALRRGGYLRPFDRAMLLVAPSPSPAATLINLARDLGAPGRSTIGSAFGSPTIRRTLAPIRSFYAMLGWANEIGIIRWEGPGDSAIWFPLTRREMAQRIAELAEDEPAVG